MEQEFFVRSKKVKSGYDTICKKCSREKVKIHRKGKNDPRGKRISTTTSYRDIIVDFLIKRDGFICGICKQSLEGAELHINHIQPVALGGKHTMENIELAHQTCNLSQSLSIRKKSHGY